MIKVKRNTVGESVEFDIEFDGNLVTISEEFIALVAAIKRLMLSTEADVWHIDNTMHTLTELGLDEAMEES